MSTATSRSSARTRAKKSLGQHFLIDSSVVAKIADALEIADDDTFLEIGAGRGILTTELAARACRVVAIELDDKLADELNARFAGTNVEVVHGDALELDPEKVVGKATYLLAGNLPYNVAQPILRHYLEAQRRPERMVVMVQSEVADSIVAKPGQMSLLSVAVQLYGEPRLLFHVPPSAFRPPPRVRSAVVRIDVAGGLRAGVDDTRAFFDLVRAGFSTRRKQLRNSLANGLGVDAVEAAAWLSEAGIDATLRPQSLSLEQWATLYGAWASAGRPGSTL